MRLRVFDTPVFGRFGVLTQSGAELGGAIRNRGEIRFERKLKLFPIFHDNQTNASLCGIEKTTSDEVHRYAERLEGVTSSKVGQPVIDSGERERTTPSFFVGIFVGLANPDENVESAAVSLDADQAYGCDRGLGVG